MPCSSAEDLFEKIRPKGRKDGPLQNLYRGHGDTAFRLVPGALRKYDQDPVPVVQAPSVRATSSLLPNFVPRKWTSAEVAFKEAQLLRHFVDALDRIGIAVPGDGKKFRKRLDGLQYPSVVDGLESWPLEEHHALLAVAQHHGLPTRLLDWSKSAIVACYFAAASCLTDARKPKQFCVWRMYEGAVDGERLRIVRAAPAHSRNLAAQLGVFTLTPATNLRDGSPIEVLAVDDLAQRLGSSFTDMPTFCTLHAFTLDRRHAADLLELCEAYGVSGATMFPGHDGACRQAMEKAARIAEQDYQSSMSQAIWSQILRSGADEHSSSEEPEQSAPQATSSRRRD